MRRSLVVWLCLLAGVTHLRAQAVTEWVTASGVAAVVVETPGGDVEHLAAAIPREAAVAGSVLGFPVEVSATPSHRVALVTVPARLSAVVLLEFSKVIASEGCIAIVALGPAAARDLEAPLESLTAARRADPRVRSCEIADGGIQLFRGDPEGVDLSFAAPGPADPRFDLLPGLAGWLQRTLAGDFPGVRVDVSVAGRCASLIVRTPAVSEEPRATLVRLRRAIRTAAGGLPRSDDVAAIEQLLERRKIRWATDGRAVARDLVERAAAGGSVAGSLVSPFLDPESLAALARGVLAGHSGLARIVEQERRAVGAEVEILENGVSVALHRLPANVAVVSLALSGLGSDSAQAILGAFGDRAADRGWFAQRSELLGVPTVAAAMPPDDLVEALELLAASVVTTRVPAVDPLSAIVSQELGLEANVRGSGVAIAVGLPAGIEEVREAVAKFFSSILPERVTSEALHTGAALQWAVTEERPRILATVDIESSPSGLLAGQIIIERLRDHAATSARWQGVPGRLVLLVDCVGDRDVPALDAQQASTWQQACRPVDQETAERAARVLVSSLYGDLLRAASRSAAERFLPSLESPESLLVTDPRVPSGLLRGLPRWEDLRRFARGPAPAAPPPRRPVVRESRPRP